MKKSKELCSLWNNEQELQTGNVKISELHEFKGHPFRVEHDMQLFELSKSIDEKGILVPLIVRPNPDGEGYEIIAGHRRKAACEWAGVDTVPVMVMQMDDAEATIAMIDSNLQREHIRPSEKAFAYKRKKLNGKSPYEAFCFYYGKDLADKLGCHEVDANSINLTPGLLKK
ncbi:MAG: ParB/RepB/Spo0J family partition protein [Candidatus Galacturonibacter soehngenii]|nr:ParB/RepB/Spo0J family partition protein [Candidatus Galacturonibacter soehngenii]